MRVTTKISFFSTKEDGANDTIAGFQNDTEIILWTRGTSQAQALNDGHKKCWYGGVVQSVHCAIEKGQKVQLTKNYNSIIFDRF